MANLICAGAETADLHRPGPLTIVLVMEFNAFDLGTPAAPGPVWSYQLDFWDSDWNEPRGDDDLLVSFGNRVPPFVMDTVVPDVPVIYRFMVGEQDEWDNEWGRDELYIRARLFPDRPGFTSSERVVGLIPRRW